MLAHGVADQERTRTFARYSLIGALSMAAGALAAAAPDFLALAGIGAVERLQADVLCLCGAGRAERRCSTGACRTRRWMRRAPSAPLGPSRGMVYKLSALFSLDSFAGGFVVQSLLALWLFERFDLSLSAASLFFFWASTRERVLLSGGGVAGDAHRPHQHHGVHAHPVEHPADRGGVLAKSVCDARPAAAALRAVADGRADAHLLRHGGGDAAGARRRRKLHRGAAQPRLGASARPSPACC